MTAKKKVTKRKPGTRRTAKQEEQVPNTLISHNIISVNKDIAVGAEHLETVNHLASALEANAMAIHQLSLGMDLERVSITDNSIGMKIEGNRS